MKVTIKDSDALLDIEPKNLEEYLKNNEWEYSSDYVDSDENTIGTIYKKYSERVHRQGFVYVLNEKTQEYVMRMAENLAVLEMIENKSQIQLYVNITKKRLEIEVE